MSISYDGIGCQLVTVPADGCVEGQVCRINLLGKAAACFEGDRFCGVVHAVKNGMAAVQMDGFVKVSYSGSKPSMGYTALAANGSGGVVTNTEGQTFLVVAVDTNELTAIIKL